MIFKTVSHRKPLVPEVFETRDIYPSKIVTFSLLYIRCGQICSIEESFAEK